MTAHSVLVFLVCQVHQRKLSLYNFTWLALQEPREDNRAYCVGPGTVSNVRRNRSNVVHVGIMLRVPLFARRVTAQRRHD